MTELMEIYRRSYEQLRQRHEELTVQQLNYSKRAALLEEEMDELQEVMCMMRPYLREE